ncbi:MAG: septum formation family protein [Vicinamibacterales bacterium]
MASARPGVAAAAVLVAAVLLGGCASGVRDSAGQVTAPATTDSFSVRVGDCLDKLPTDSTAKISLLPCAQPHYWEAFASPTLAGDDFPGNSAVRDQAESACTDAFQGFVGVAAKSSKLDLTMLTPTKETWTQAGDREVVCLVGSAKGGVTGTLKGANR